MQILSVLALIALANNKTLREAAIPSEYGKLSSLVERLKADVPGTLATVLRDEAGIEWDGTHATLWSSILNEAKRQAEIHRLLTEFDAESMRRLTARKALQFPKIAGRDGVDAAANELR